MELQRLEALAEKYMGHRKSHIEREIGHVYFHGKRVANGVLLLRKKLFPEDASHDDVLFCAGLFHDVGKGIEPHPRTGSTLVRELLCGEMTPEEMEAVCGLIAVHDDRRADSPHSPWVKLLQDADLLDHFGIQGVWLSFTYYAYMGQKGMSELPEFYETEWKPMVAKNRKLLNFPFSREIFDEKTTYEWSVIQRLKEEGTGAYLERTLQSL
ncbi:HD domain-containing protein [Neglectibacter caecimuris]|uniref:HD domain-containing protein n=1 Tax=Neglectibacter caecimuris TaxID=3093658 RepID=UPI002AC97D31|nr:HD domain-containing protein [Neglectibacter sp. M00184]